MTNKEIHKALADASADPHVLGFAVVILRRDGGRAEFVTNLERQEAGDVLGNLAALLT